MKKIDKIKRQWYEISMKIIEIESKSSIKGLSKNEAKELSILKEKEIELSRKMNTFPQNQ